MSTTTTTVVANKQDQGSISSSSRISFVVDSYCAPVTTATCINNGTTRQDGKSSFAEQHGEDLSVNSPGDQEKNTGISKFKEHCLHIGKRVLTQLLKYWFLVGMAIAIGLAWAFPQVGKTNGDIQAQYSIKWGAVIVIFLLSGLGLEIRQMVHTVLRWRLHLVVQSINFILLPFVMYGIVRFYIAVGADLTSVVYQGLVIALSTNTTVSSNAVMTRNANGNDSAGT